MNRVEFLSDDFSADYNSEKSLLEFALKKGIPIAHSCGGLARCSTCRVSVIEGLDSCSPRNDAEIVMAKKLSFPDSIRLACQTSVSGPVKLRRLVLDPNDEVMIGEPGAITPKVVGIEKDVAVLFADIRGFTTFSEKLPPYDIVHVLNRYFYAMGDAIRAHGGDIYNYMGDGLMAIFGVHKTECQVTDAVKAAFSMQKKLEDLRPYLQSIWGKCFQIGIGIHYGTVVIGEIGAQGSQRVTAIGDAVNVASRIESMTKIAQTSLLISEAAHKRIMERIPTRAKCSEIALAGRSGKETLYEVLPFDEAVITKGGNNVR